MDLEWSATDLAFRNEVRTFLDDKLTPELRRAGRLMTRTRTAGRRRHAPSRRRM